MITACKHTEYEYDDLTIRAEVTTWNGLKFYGKATCSPEDKYNKSFGERLARARAIDKMINYNCRELDRIDNIIHKNYIQKIQKVKKIQDRINWQAEKNESVYEELKKELAESLQSRIFLTFFIFCDKIKENKEENP